MEDLEQAKNLFDILQPHEKQAYMLAMAIRRDPLWLQLKKSGAYCSVFTLTEERLDPLGTYQREKPWYKKLYDAMSPEDIRDMVQIGNKDAKGGTEDMVKVGILGPVLQSKGIQTVSRRIADIARVNGATEKVSYVSTGPFEQSVFAIEASLAGTKLSAGPQMTEYNSLYQFSADNPMKVIAL